MRRLSVLSVVLAFATLAHGAAVTVREPAFGLPQYSAPAPLPDRIQRQWCGRRANSVRLGSLSPDLIILSVFSLCSVGATPPTKGSEFRELGMRGPRAAGPWEGFWLRSRLSLCSMVADVVPSSSAILLSLSPCARRISSRSTVTGDQGNRDINARPTQL